MVKINSRTLSTKEAFEDLISQENWYKNIFIDGKQLNKNTAFNAKRRFLGLSPKGLSIETMEKYLEAAGYIVAQEKLWIK